MYKYYIQLSKENYEFILTITKHFNLSIDDLINLLIQTFKEAIIEKC